MENVILIVHLILALCLIGVVLLQRSEGGGLGMGSSGGGGGGGVMTGRQAASALGKLTWAFAIAFIATSLVLTVLAARDATDSSVVDRITDRPAPAAATDSDAPEGGDALLPPVPVPSGDAPLTPPRAE